MLIPPVSVIKNNLYLFRQHCASPFLALTEIAFVDSRDAAERASGLDYHYRAVGEQPLQLFDIFVVHRNASGGPVDIAPVQDRFVAAMDSDSAAHAERMAVFVRHRAAVAQFLVAAPVQQVWIIQRQEPIPAAAGMLLDEGVPAGWRAPGPCPQGRAGRESAPEHGRGWLKHPAG